jgi:hypothetical protein
MNHQIKGPSRSRIKIRPNAVRASLMRHYLSGAQREQDAEIEAERGAQPQGEGAG